MVSQVSQKRGCKKANEKVGGTKLFGELLRFEFLSLKVKKPDKNEMNKGYSTLSQHKGKTKSGLARDSGAVSIKLAQKKRSQKLRFSFVFFSLLAEGL